MKRAARRSALVGGHALLAAVLLSGCAGDGAAVDRDQGMSDGSIQPNDQGFRDSGPSEDLGLDAGPIDDAAVIAADPARFAPFLTVSGTFGRLRDDEPAPWTSCYAEPSGCAAEPCSLLATCCVGDGQCADLRLDGALPGALLFNSCASGASALTCLPGQPLTAVGSSEPRVESGGLRPGGDASREGGVLVGQPLDLRLDRVDLSVVFMPPVACPESRCLESAGVSVARADEAAQGLVTPLVGLLYSASRGDVSLMVGDQRRAAWPLTDANASFTLELHPSGVVRVHRDQELLTSGFVYSPVSSAQVVLHGRNTELQGARIRSLHAVEYRGETPAVFGTRLPITLTAPVDVDPWAPRNPAVVEHEGRTYVVVENDGALYRGELLGTTVAFDSEHRVVVDSGREDALLAPALLVRPSGETFLVYAAKVIDGTLNTTFAIRARRGVDGPLGPLPDQLAVASAPRGESLDDPSVIEHQGHVLLLVRHRYHTGNTELELWRSDGLEPSTLRDLRPAPASNLGALTHVDNQESQQEQRRAPHLSVRGGTYRVHFERRTGTRSVIEMLAGDELRAFRSLGEVLGPRVGQLDSLGVGSPSALQDADGSESLYYVGRDGLGERLFVTERVGVLDPQPLRSAP